MSRIYYNRELRQRDMIQFHYQRIRGKIRPYNVYLRDVLLHSNRSLNPWEQLCHEYRHPSHFPYHNPPYADHQIKLMQCRWNIGKPYVHLSCQTHPHHQSFSHNIHKQTQ